MSLLVLSLILLSTTFPVVVSSQTLTNSESISCGIYNSTSFSRIDNNTSNLYLKTSQEDVAAAGYNHSNPCPLLEISDLHVGRITLELTKYSVTRLVFRNITAGSFYLLSTRSPDSGATQEIQDRNLVQNSILFDSVRAVSDSATSSALYVTNFFCRSLIIRNSQFVRKMKESTPASEQRVLTTVYVALSSVSEEFLFDNNYVFGRSRAVQLYRMNLGGALRMRNSILKADDQGVLIRAELSYVLNIYVVSFLLPPSPGQNYNSTNNTDKLKFVKFDITNNTLDLKLHREPDYLHVFSGDIYLPNETSVRLGRLVDFANISFTDNTVKLDGTGIGIPTQPLNIDAVRFEVRRSGVGHVEYLRNSIKSHIMFRMSGIMTKMADAISDQPLAPHSNVTSSFVAAENTIELLTRIDSVDLSSVAPLSVAKLNQEIIGIDMESISGHFSIINIENNNFKQLQLYRPIGVTMTRELFRSQELSFVSKVFGIALFPAKSRGTIDLLCVTNNTLHGDITSDPEYFVNIFIFLVLDQNTVPEPNVYYRNVRIQNNSMDLVRPAKISAFTGFALGESDFTILDSFSLENNVVNATSASINQKCAACRILENDPIIDFIQGGRDNFDRADSSIVSLGSLQASGKDTNNDEDDQMIHIKINNNKILAAVPDATTKNPNPRLIFLGFIIGDVFGVHKHEIEFSDNHLLIGSEDRVFENNNDRNNQHFFAATSLLITVGIRISEIVAARNQLVLIDGTSDHVVIDFFRFSNSPMSSSSSSRSIELSDNSILYSGYHDNPSQNSQQLFLESYAKSSGFKFTPLGPVPRWRHIQSPAQLQQYPPTSSFVTLQNFSLLKNNNGNLDYNNQLQIYQNKVSIAHSEFHLVNFMNNSQFSFEKISLQANDVHLAREANCTKDQKIVMISGETQSASSATSTTTTIDISPSCNRIHFWNNQTKLLDLSRLKKVTNERIKIIDDACEIAEVCFPSLSTSRSYSQTESLTSSNSTTQIAREIKNPNVLSVSSEVSAALTTTSVVQSLSMASMAVGAAATPALGFSIGRQQAMMNYALKTQQGDCRGLMPGTISSEDDEDEEVDYSLPTADSPTQMKIGTQHPSSPAAPFYVGAVVGNFVMILGIILLNQLIGHIATKIIIKKYCPPSEYNRKKDLWKNYFYVFANSFVSLSLFYMIAILLSPTLTSAVSILAGTSNEVVSIGLKIVCFLIAAIISSVGVYFVVWSTYIRKPRREVYRIFRELEEDERKQKELGVMQLFKKLCKADGEWKIPLNERTTKETHAFQISEPCYESYRKNQWFAIVEIVVAVLLCLPPLFAQLASSGKSSCIVQGVLLFLILLGYTILLIWKNPKKLMIMRFFVPAMAVQQTLVVGMTLIAVLTTSEDDSKSDDNVGAKEWLWKTIFVPLGFEIVLATVSAVSSIFPFLAFLKKLSVRIMQARNALRDDRRDRMSFSSSTITQRHHQTFDHHHHHNRRDRQQHSHQRHSQKRGRRTTLEDLYFDPDDRNDREMSLLPPKSPSHRQFRDRDYSNSSSSLNRRRDVSAAAASSSSRRRYDNDDHHQHHRRSSVGDRHKHQSRNYRDHDDTHNHERRHSRSSHRSRREATSPVLSARR